jgi:hypothetical protein
LAKRAVSPLGAPFTGGGAYRIDHPVTTVTLSRTAGWYETGGRRRTLHLPRPCVGGVACVAQEISRPRPQHSSVYPRVEPSQIEGATWPSQGRREAALGQAVVRVESWQNFTDTRCESSNPSSTDGGSFSLYCSPVLRHSAGLIQAANFRSAVVF